MTNAVIRKAEPGDLPLIVQLIGELADYEKLRDQCVVTEAALGDFLFGKMPLIHCLIAEVKDPESNKMTAAGFALYFFNFSTFLGRPGLHLEDIFVRPAFRGAGIGRSFFNELAAAARRNGCARMEWSVLNWNTPSIGFYKGLGAVPMDDWTVYRLTGENLEQLARQSIK